MDRSRSALVVTIVHDPRDSRIWFRQIAALLGAGWRVTYAAPFTAEALVPTHHLEPDDRERLRLVTLPKARARDRIRAVVAARRVIRAEATRHGVVLIHDPELLAATVGLELPNLVWDVHEDTVAALPQKLWLPAALRPITGWAVRRSERWAERRFHLILAEDGYRQRFGKSHVVVPNTVVVPDRIVASTGDRVVYLGTITRARGGDLLPEIGRLLRARTGGTVVLEVIGPTYDDETRRGLTEAADRGDLVWRGFLPADQALGRLAGALAGLSLLDDTPNYRASMPTKILEYCAYGVPVITTPLPLAAALVEQRGVGVVVPWRDPDAVVAAAIRLRTDPSGGGRMGRLGHAAAADGYDWRQWSKVFVDELSAVAGDRHRLELEAGAAVRRPARGNF